MKVGKDYPRLIRTVRQRTGLSQERFAAKIGVTFPSINRWENGKTTPSRLALRQVKQLLETMGEQGRDLLDEFFSDENS
ncbi:MAG: helix-turn-helix transcriptional regulator [Calditrichaeota bacterium]|nr:helix-turn-helix transcriptional regulator [Calditrichota bacterium]